MLAALRRLCCLAILLWLAAPGHSTASSAQDLHLRDLDAVLEKILTRGDRAPSQLFYELAAGRDVSSFGKLREGLEQVEDQSLAVAAYGACALFKGSPIEGQVADWLSGVAFKSQRETHQLAATAALCYFWSSEELALMRVLKNHRSAACRALALRPLVPQLVFKGDRSSCKLIFENAAVDGASERGALLAALREFASRSVRDYLTDRLREQSLETDRKLVLLDLYARSDDPVAIAAIEKRLGDPIDAVRLRAMQVLGRQRDGASLERLERIAKYGDEAFIVKAIETLASQREGDSAWIEELYGFTRNQSSAVRLGATRALGRIPTQDSLTLLHRLLLDDDRRVKLAAMEEIGKKRQPQSLPRMITALGKNDGVVAVEIARWLRLFTGEDHGTSAARWKSWFQVEGQSFQMPTRIEAERLENERLVRRNAGGEMRTASFYGLQIDSDRITFVIDLSGSMDDPAGGRGTSSRARGKTRLDVAKQEVRNALRQLLNGVYFNLITFSSDASAAHPELAELNGSSRARALQNVEDWSASGGTAIYDGLKRALADRKTDTVYLLTDGEPTMGEVTDPVEIHRRIVEVCKLRGVRIHSVAIGRASQLLEDLADDTGGQYVEIL